MPGCATSCRNSACAGDLVDILLAEHRLGHAREVGEFVDHPPQVADLADDRAGQPLEGLRVRCDLLAEAALQPLGGELDRGQRVLDLMRDAPGDVGPGGAALVGQLVGDVVEGQHRRRPGSARASPRACAGPLPAATRTSASRCSPRMNSSSSGETSASWRAFELVLALLQQRLGRAVDQQDAARRIERDDAGGDARQHRLDEGAAGVELGVGGDQRAGLLLEPPGHPVEGACQASAISSSAVGDRNAGREIAFLDPARGVDQLRRPAEPAGRRA